MNHVGYGFLTRRLSLFMVFRVFIVFLFSSYLAAFVNINKQLLLCVVN